MARIAEIEGHTCCTRDQLFYQLDMGQIDGQWFAHELRALRDALFTAPSNGSQRMGGVSARGRCRCREEGDSDCDVHPTCEGCGLRLDTLTQYQSPPWKRLCVGCYREESKKPIEAGLAELKNAPAVAAPGVACEWDLSDAEEK